MRLPARDVAVHGLWAPDCRGVITFMIVADLLLYVRKIRHDHESALLGAAWWVAVRRRIPFAWFLVPLVLVAFVLAAL